MFIFFTGLCKTAKFYGDTNMLQFEQIQEIVDRIYDSITKVTFENVDDNSIQQKDLSFDEFVKALLRQKDIQDIVLLPLEPKQVRTQKSRRSTKSVHQVGSTTSRFGSPIVRKSALKITSIYDFGNHRDEETSVKKHVPSSPKGPKHQPNDKNTNKYMPLIDEIEKDARKKMKHSSYKEGTANIIKTVSTEPDDAMVVSTSSSSDNIDALDPNCIHVTTTEEDDNNDDNNSLQDEQDDTSETDSDDKSVKDDAILTTLKDSSKVKQPLTTSLKQQQHKQNSTNVISNNLYSMALETSETTVSPASQSVQSTDLSSHMSSVMLKPVARVRVSHHHSHRV